MVLHILFHWSRTPVHSQLMFCMHLCVGRCIPDISVETDVLHVHLLLCHLVFPFLILLTFSLPNFLALSLWFLLSNERSVFIPIPKKGNAKECSNYHTIALISHASKVVLKILQARLQQYINHELPDVQAGFRKGRGTRDQIANIHWITKKQETSRKTSISVLLTMPKPLTVWITRNCGKFW